jgi:LytS/YehU family sensor histidine kinase
LELEARLTSARLQALQMQLNPHFLFNALTGIAALMYRDVELADSMLMKLAGLLRHVVDRGPETHVKLRDELEFLDRYLALEQMRFGPRIQVRREIAPETLFCRVPNLLMQPLVENAIQHGLEPKPQGGTITLRASRTAEGRLRLEVGDDGCGLPPGGEASGGVGTGNVRTRVQQLYGRRGSVVFAPAPAPGSGVWVTVEIPWETA